MRESECCFFLILLDRAGPSGLKDLCRLGGEVVIQDELADIVHERREEYALAMAVLTGLGQAACGQRSTHAVLPERFHVDELRRDAPECLGGRCGQSERMQFP